MKELRDYPVVVEYLNTISAEEKAVTLGFLSLYSLDTMNDLSPDDSIKSQINATLISQIIESLTRGNDEMIKAVLEHTNNIHQLVAAEAYDA